MENIKRLSCIHLSNRRGIRRPWLVICLLAVAHLLPAQKGFEDRLEFDSIQTRLKNAIARRDLRKQALGWYHWAIYRENETANRDSAFQYLARSVDLFNRAKDTVAYQRARAELATRLAERGKADEALKIQQEALDYFRQVGNRRLETLVLAKMARVYQMKGDTAQAKVLKKAFLEKSRLQKDTLLMINVFMEDVAQLHHEKKYRSAISLAFRVLELAQQTNRQEFVNWAEYNIGLLNEENKDFHMALRFFRRAERSITSMYNPVRRDIYRHLSTTYSALDSLSLALEYARRYILLADTILTRDRLATSDRLAVQFGERERQRELDIMTQQLSAIEAAKKEQQNFFYVLLLFFGAIILAMFFIVRDYRHRLYTNRVIAEQNEKINRQTIQQLEDALRIESMQSMLEGQESERRRIAYDLHDSLGGLLAATKMRLEGLANKVPALDKNNEFSKIKDLLDDTIAETRQISRNLQPGSLDQFGLMKAIGDLAARVRGEGVPAIDFQHFGSFTNIDHTVALNCYRIVQELLQNSIKHANASEILVQLTRTDAELVLLVEDNGVGYDPESVEKGMGTDNLSQRVQFIKGEISIQSAKGQGTSTMVTVPLG